MRLALTRPLCCSVLLAVYTVKYLTLAHEVPSIPCCSVLAANDHGRLLKCLNTSSADQYTKALSQEATQPALTVTLVSRVTPEVSSYGAYSRMVLNMYAEHHGYTVLPLWKDSDRADYPYHRKIVPLIDVVRSTDVYSDYIAWVDAGRSVANIFFRNVYLTIACHSYNRPNPLGHELSRRTYSCAISPRACSFV